VWDTVLRVQGSGFRVKGLRSGVERIERAQGLELRVSGSGFRV
jgi:hypothetical protein